MAKKRIKPTPYSSNSTNSKVSGRQVSSKHKSVGEKLQKMVKKSRKY